MGNKKVKPIASAFIAYVYKLSSPSINEGATILLRTHEFEFTPLDQSDYLRF
jgi:hypothetical protein